MKNELRGSKAVSSLMFSCVFILVLGLQFLLIPAGWAQMTSEEIKKMEPVVVTGSLIPTYEDVGASPVTAISGADIDKIGAKDVAELMKKLPQNIGGGNYTAEGRGNGGDGSGAVALRGIDNGTLVLINGRRIAPNQFLGNANVDISAIPLAMIERIEILKDGGSALYGSDAIAGVVNIITKKNYNGGEATISYGNTTEKDAGQQSYSFVTGVNNEKASVLVGATYYKQNGMLSVDRKRSEPGEKNFLNTSVNSNPGWVGYGQFGTPDPEDENYPRGVVYRGTMGTYPTSPSEFTDYSAPEDRYLYPIWTTLLRPLEKYSIFGNVDYQVMDEKVVAFAETMYSRTININQLAPTPVNYAVAGQGIPATNPYNVFGEDIDYWFYRFLELGPRQSKNSADLFRFVGGLKGDLEGLDRKWKWETAYLYSEDRRQEIDSGDVNVTALVDAINRTDASAFNPFGFASNAGAQLEGMGQTLFINSLSTLKVVDAKISGELFDLPGGKLQLVVGGGWMEEEASFTPDVLTATGNTVGFNQYAPFEGARDVWSVFAELSIPIIGPDQDIPLITKLEVNAAVRYDDYSDFGDTTNPKVTARWEPLKNESLIIRGSYGTSFQAPRFGDLYGSFESFPEVRNPFTAEFDQPTDGVTYAANPDLKPQKSDNYSIGFVYSPPIVKGLSINVDYYRLKIKDWMAASAQFVIDQNYVSAGGDPYLVNDPATDFYDKIEFDPVTRKYSYIEASTFNLNEVLTDGFDIGLEYIIPTDNMGQFTLSASMAYVLTFDVQVTAGGITYDKLGDYDSGELGFQSIPRLRGIFSCFWNYKKLELGATVNYTGAYRDDPLAGPDAAAHEISSNVTVDLQASYQLPWDTRLTVGCLNIMDEKPPLVIAAFENNYDNALFDIRQRFVYASLTKKF